MLTLETDKIYSVSETDKLITEAIKDGTLYKTKKLSYYNIICAFDIETTNYISDSETYIDEYLYNYMRGTVIRCKEITPVNSVTGLTFSKTKGIPIDEYYQDLCVMFPGTFPETYRPDEQMNNLIEVFKDNIPSAETNKQSIMYCWQFAINGRVIFGRTWEEFKQLIDTLNKYTNKHLRLLIYVHNLAFEFQYIRTMFNWHKVFSIAPRKPIYAITADGLEFRCSYILTNYSLAKLSDQLQKNHIKKLVGELDYKLERSPLTPMSWNEISYCINDVLVVSAYIDEQREIEKGLQNIPLTATGYCRRYCRKMCLYGKNKKYRNAHYKQYRALMDSLTIDGADEYNQLRRAFQGGFTHASARFSGVELQNVDSIDFTSSYPYCLLSELYPMSSGQKVEPKTPEEFKHYLKYYCCIFDVEFKGLLPKCINENYISTSHCYIKENYVANNGRIVSADRICTTITNIDFDIIRRTYIWKTIKIRNMRIYRKGYLPRDLLLAIIKLYQDKTTLKGVIGKEQEYLNGKALLNAVYGMMVTSISKDEIIYEDTWTVEPADIEKDVDKYNKSIKRFLFYPWGVFCTAYARANLWCGILNFGDDYIYADTDSIKCLNLAKHMDYVNSYNKLCEKKLRVMCQHMNIDYSELEPLTIKGEKKPLGVWDFDGHYDKFKTLGAKRYLVEQNGNIHMTVAGVNKHVAVPYLRSKYGNDIFTYFNSGLEIPAGQTGKLTHVYLDSLQSGVMIDYLGKEYKYREQPPGVFLEDAAYYFDIAQDYLNYIKGVQFRK